MSGFDVKLSLRKAIVIEDFFYAVSKEIFGYLSENLYVNLEYVGTLKPWKTCYLTIMKPQLKTV